MKLRNYSRIGRRLALALLAAAPLFGQCPTGTLYPGALDTNTSLTVAKNNLTTTLTAQQQIADTVAIVASTAGFTANMMIAVDSGTATEYEFVGSVTGMNTLNVTRACESSTAVVHLVGVSVVNIISAYSGHTSLTGAVTAIETALGPNLNLVPGTSSGPAVTVAHGGTGVTTATAHGVAVGETTSPLAFTSAGTLGQVLTSNGAAADPTYQVLTPGTALPAGSQLNYLRIQPNTGNNTTTQFANLPQVNVNDYNYLAQSCNSSLVCTAGGATGGALVVGNNTLTMTPVPLGINGSDTNHWAYVSGGVGTAEACLITGGGGTSGQTSGAIIINCANTHSGAFTVGSATAGGKEAANVSPSVYFPDGTYNFFSSMNLTGDAEIFCASTHAVIQANFGTQNLLVWTGSAATQRFFVYNCNLSTVPAKTAGDAIQLNGSGGISAKGALIVGVECQAQWNCVHSVSAGQWSLVGVQSRAVQNFDVYIQNTNGTDAGDNSIVNCFFDNSNSAIGEGIHWESGGGLYVANTKILNHLNGIALRPADGVTTSDFLFNNNSIELFSVAGITMSRLNTTGAIQSIIVQGNQMSSGAANTFGIATSNGITNLTISSNVISATLNGISITNTAGVKIQGNKILNASTGVAMGSGNTGLLEVFDNQMSGNTTNYSGTALFEDTVSGLTFAQITSGGLGPSNGSQVFCTDCNATCAAGASTGRMCFRENGAWTH